MLVRISLFSMVLAHALCVEFVLISHSNHSQHSGSLIGRFCRLISFNLIILLSTQNLVLVEQVRMHLQFLTNMQNLPIYICHPTFATFNCAGRGAKEANLYTEIAEGIYSYGITRHRHGKISNLEEFGFSTS